MKRWLYVLIGLLVLTLGGLALRQYLRNQGLYLKSSSPRNGGTAGSVDSLTFTFNRELEDSAVKRFRLDPALDGRVELEGRTLKFHPTTSYKFGGEYTATVEQPRSKDGKSMEDVRIKFKVGFVEKPTKDQRRQESERTDSLQRQYPLLAHVPHETLHFKIDYQFQSTDEDSEGLETDKVLVLKITLNAILNRPDQRDSYLADLKQYKQEALEYIRSKGEDPAKYQIDYSPTEASSL